jgi:LmbE family N-acetylglucosaminyl deacetylase
VNPGAPAGGIRRPWRAARVMATTISLIVAASAALLPGAKPAFADCSDRTMVIAAHQDDDVIFKNADVQHDIARGACVRVVFITAGNAGRPWTDGYAQQRERGALSDYAVMAGATLGFQADPVPLYSLGDANLSGHPGPLYTLLTNPGISVVFLRLADGGVDGSAVQSLEKLWTNQIPQMDAIDGSSSYDRTSLVSNLGTLIANFGPTELRIQDYVNDRSDGDHSDHHFGARFAFQAGQDFATSHTPPHIDGYRGYPIVFFQQNVFGTDLSTKMAIWQKYQEWDPQTPSPPALLDMMVQRNYVVGGGEIRGIGNKCLDVRGGQDADFTVVQIWDCDGSAAQSWTITPQGNYVEAHTPAGRCLTLPLPTFTSAYIATCSGAPSQRFVLSSSGELRTPLQGTKCLDVRGPTVVNGADTQSANCVGAANQHWAGRGVPPPGEEVHGLNGRCLDVRGPSLANGTVVQNVDCAGVLPQLWALNTAGELRNSYGDQRKCLTAVFASVVTYDCIGASVQRWSLNTSGQLQLVGTTYCLDMVSPVDGTASQIVSCGSSFARQKWSIGGQFISPTIQFGAGNCLDAPEATSGAPTRLVACNAAPSQHWDNTSTAHELRSAGTRCLEAHHPSSADGAAVQVADCTGPSNQQWTITASNQLQLRGTTRCATAIFNLVGLWACGAYPSLQTIKTD